MLQMTRKEAKARDMAIRHECKIFQDVMYRKHDLHMTQEQVAEKTGIALDRILDHEAGKYDAEVSAAYISLWRNEMKGV